jgi:hypothetical protein
MSKKKLQIISPAKGITTEIPGRYFTTTDFDRFKFIPGNRDVRPTVVEKLAEDIRVKGQSLPIVVNEKWEVIDGQHRLHACVLLERPIELVVKPGLTIADVPRINTLQNKWSPEDHLLSHARQGNENYIKFKKYMDQYKLKLQGTYALIFGEYCSSDRAKAFRAGQLVITPEVENKFLSKCRQYREVLAVNDSQYRRQLGSAKVLPCLARLLNHPKYEHGWFIKRLRAASPYDIHVPNGTEDAIRMILKLYNTRRQKGEKINLGVNNGE